MAVEYNLLYIPCCYKNEILLFDMEYDRVTSLAIGEKTNKYIRIVKDEQNFYLISKNSTNLIIWNENDICREINIDFKKKYFDAYICQSNKYIWIISVISGEIYQISKDDNEIECFEFKGELDVIYVETYLEGLCFQNACTGKWYYMDSKGAIKDLKIEMKDSRSKSEIWKAFNSVYSYRIEDKMLPIEYLISLMMNREDLVRRNRWYRQVVGQKIWNQLYMEPTRH